MPRGNVVVADEPAQRIRKIPSLALPRRTIAFPRTRSPAFTILPSSAAPTSRRRVRRNDQRGAPWRPYRRFPSRRCAEPPSGGRRPRRRPSPVPSCSARGLGGPRARWCGAWPRRAVSYLCLSCRGCSCSAISN